MSGGHKRILSPFTGRKRRKAWNKTREKYMPEEKTQNLAETCKRSYYNQEEWLKGTEEATGGVSLQNVWTIKVRFTMQRRI